MADLNRIWHKLQRPRISLILSQRWGLLLFSGFVLFFLFSCINPSASTTYFKNIPQSNWSPEFHLEFSPDSADLSAFTEAPDRLVLHIRYNSSVSVKSLPLVLFSESYFEPASRDTVIINLYRDKKPSGAGKFGVYTLSDTIPLNAFPEGWRLTISSISPETIKGIQAVGISLTNHSF